MSSLSEQVMFAADTRDHEKVVKLLQMGDDINKEVTESRTPSLDEATPIRDIAMVRLVLEHNAEVGTPNKPGWTSLMTVGSSGDVRVVLILLEYRS